VHRGVWYTGGYLLFGKGKIDKLVGGLLVGVCGGSRVAKGVRLRT
jgi:hypothetical protein